MNEISKSTDGDKLMTAKVICSINEVRMRREERARIGHTLGMLMEFAEFHFYHIEISFLEHLIQNTRAQPRLLF